MSATKGQIIGLLEEIRDELRGIDRMLGCCDTCCVSLGRTWRLIEDLENGLNGVRFFDPDYKSDGGEDYTGAEEEP